MAQLSAAAEQLKASPLWPAERQEELRLKLLAALAAVDQAGRRADRLMTAVEQKQSGAGRLFWNEAAADDLGALLHGIPHYRQAWCHLCDDGRPLLCNRPRLPHVRRRHEADPDQHCAR
jgi:hypothetical protein